MSVKKKSTVKTAKEPAHLITQVNLDHIQWAAGRSRRSYNESDGIAFLKDTKDLTTDQLTEKYGLKKSSLYSRISNTKKRFIERIREGNNDLLQKLQSEGLLVEKE